ncbi:amidohydrolase family protein [Bordetella sp. N]|uniref:N-acyl-D-amino-acid deacylase family protein n=1 Tax=Bordetella sp. N TaxID=1746199 RepID=UPI0007095FE3|nr:D-aminoacylase [Bordetella sp. N]ALM82605.1 D-aminoacylase [Bordetella sp. N]
MFDLVFKGGTVIDGTGAPRREADVGIVDRHIAAVGNLSDEPAHRIVDATGLIVAPGFIDAHAHDDCLLLSSPDMTPKLSQGVTTVVAGNCGMSLAPMPRPVPQPVTPPLDLLNRGGEAFRFATFAAYLEELRQRPPAINFAMLVGHTTLRVATMQDLGATASDAEIGQMRTLAAEALEAGAIGISTGLAYVTAMPATTDEVVRVCADLNAFGGVYCTHMRDESSGIMDALTETFDIGRQLNVPVVISHHKLSGAENFGRSRETLPYIEDAARKQPVCLDCYPYDAGSTVLEVWRVRRCDRVIITWSTPHPEMAGRTLNDIAESFGVDREEAAARLMPGGAIYFSMDAQDVDRILAYPPTMIGSDGLPHDSQPHPRLWGAFPRVLGHYARHRALFSLETAVHKMTGLPAANFGFKGRGIIAPGACADITTFDALTVDAGFGYGERVRPARGIVHVAVNGAIAWENGAAAGGNRGELVKRSAMA